MGKLICLLLIGALLCCTDSIGQTRKLLKDSGKSKNPVIRSEPSTLKLLGISPPPPPGGGEGGGGDPPTMECVNAYAGADRFIPCGTSTTLGGTSYNSNYSYVWSPATGLAAPYSFNTTAAPTQTTTYTLTMIPKPNLLENGDFESGNAFFSSDYSYGLIGGNLSAYTVGPSASGIYNWWCGTSPPSPGNMLIADAPTTSGSRVWYQTITVTPGTFYRFSGQFLNLYNTDWYNQNDPTIIVKVNGRTIASEILPFASCEWFTMTSTWLSGSNVFSATIEIYANPRVADGVGCDFAIDNLVFTTSDCSITTSQVTVTTVTRPTITTSSGMGPLSTSYAIDKGTLSIISNNDVRLCLFYGSDYGINVSLASSASTNLQWYRNGSPISNATSQTYGLNYAGGMSASGNNPWIDQYTVSTDGCMSDPVNVTVTQNPSWRDVVLKTATSAEFIDYLQFPSFFPPSVIDPNFNMSFSVTSPGQISSSASSTAINTTVSIPAIFPTTVTLYATYHNYGCAVQDNDRVMYFDGSSNPIITFSKKTGNLRTSAISEAIDNRNEIQITPNPVKTMITVSSRTLFRKIQIYDASGSLKRIHTRSGYTARLDVSVLPPGVYFTTVIFEKSIQTEKIIVVK